MTLAQGDIVGGKYRIRHLLGDGGMAFVYLATDLTSGRSVALKVMREHLRQHEQSVQRFLQEARASAKVQHPGVVRVFDSGQEPTFLWLTMELLNGQSLEARLRRGPLSVAELDLTLVQLLDILKAVHAAGIVHRDLKPANVFLETLPSGRTRIRLLDFGIAKLSDSQLGAFATQVGSALGTPGYMAPEQTMQAATVDARADIYALGALIYECLSNRLPFEASSLAELVGKQLSERPARIQVSDEARVYARTALICLAVDIAQRPRSCDEVRRLLRQAAPGATPPARTRTPLPPMPSQRSHRFRPALLLWPAAACVLGLAGWVLFSEETTSPAAVAEWEAVQPAEPLAGEPEPLAPQPAQPVQPVVVQTGVGTPVVSALPRRPAAGARARGATRAAAVSPAAEAAQPEPTVESMEHLVATTTEAANAPAPRVWGRAPQERVASEGELNMGAFEAVVHTHKRALQSCYEGASRFADKPPERTLHVDVNVVIDASGAPRSVTTTGDELGDMTVCLRSTIKRWSFPRSAGSASFDFPLRFAPRR